MAYMRTPDYIYAGEYDDGSIYLCINGQSLAFDVALELAVMLVAELGDAEREAAEARACAKWGGNIGCDALCVKRGLRRALRQARAATRSASSAGCRGLMRGWMRSWRRGNDMDALCGCHRCGNECRASELVWDAERRVWCCPACGSDEVDVIAAGESE